MSITHQFFHRLSRLRADGREKSERMVQNDAGDNTSILSLYLLFFFALVRSL